MFLFSNYLLAQDNSIPVISIGGAYRIEPLEQYKSGTSYINGYYLEESTILSIDIKQKVFKNNNLTIQLSNYFNYNIDRRKSLYNNKALIRDHLIDILYPISFKKIIPKAVIGIGYGAMNAHTKFIKKEIIIYSPTNLGVIYSNTSKLFFAPRLTVGIEYKALSGFINMHYTPFDSEGINNKSLWTEFKMTYSFNLFNK